MVSLDELLQMDEYDRIEYLYEEAERSGKRLNSGYEEFIKNKSRICLSLRS